MNTGEEVTGPVNLGNPGEFTIRELAETVIALTGSSSRIVHLPLPTDDPRQRRPDISKANELFAWKPSISLRDGLMKTIAYFEQQLKFEKLAADF
jgi:UDP-glucuronate decarboxylase